MTSNLDWGPFQKWLFRFVVIYVLLYILPIVWLSMLLGYTEPAEYQSSVLILVAIRVGLSIAGATIWSFHYKNAEPHPSHIYILTLALRSFLFLTMMTYGFAKVALIQFSEASLIQLVTPVGELSPMRLLWIYMGYSSVYQIFTGLLEVAGGFLLLYRRTTTLGALLIAGVMSNVALMNFMFDVPVKNLATHLFVFSLVLAAFDYKRILNVFILNKDVNARAFESPFQAEWFTKATKWIRKAMIGAVALGFIVSAALPLTSYSSKNKPEPELFGIYMVTSQEASCRENAWEYFVIDRYNQTYIRYKNNSKPYFRTLDTEQQTLTLKPQGTGSERFFTYMTNGNKLHLTEISEGDSLLFKMEKIDMEIFQLLR